MSKYKDKLEELRLKLCKAQRNFEEFKKSCPHTFKMLKCEKQAICEVCDKVMGKYCSISPDNVCHYIWELTPFSVDSILLVDGSVFNLEPSVKIDHNKDYKSECIFCGKSEDD